MRTLFFVVSLFSNLAWGAPVSGWYSDYNSAIQAWSGSGRSLVIFFTADWCGPCQKLKNEVFSEPRVSATLSNMVKLSVADTSPYFKGLSQQYFRAEFGTPAVAVFPPGNGTPQLGNSFVGYQGAGFVLSFLAPYAARPRSVEPVKPPPPFIAGPTPGATPRPRGLEEKLPDANRPKQRSTSVWRDVTELNALYERFQNQLLPAPVVFYLHHESTCEGCREWRDQHMSSDRFRDSIERTLLAVSTDAESEFGKALFESAERKQKHSLKLPVFLVVPAGVPGSKAAAKAGKWNPVVYEPKSDGIEPFLAALRSQPRMSEAPSRSEDIAPKREQPEPSSSDDSVSKAWERHAPEHALRNMGQLSDHYLESFLRQAVAKINTFKNRVLLGSGTGFLINFSEDEKYAYIVTNHHVVTKDESLVDGVEVAKEGLSFTAVFSGQAQTSCKAGLQYLSRRTDLALLAIETSCLKNSPETPVVPMARDSHVGRLSYTLGHAYGREAKFMQGRVTAHSRVETDAGECAKIEADLPVVEGVSGAPVLNEFGQLTGIVHARPLNPERKLAYIIDVLELKAMLRQYNTEQLGKR